MRLTDTHNSLKTSSAASDSFLEAAFVYNHTNQPQNVWHDKSTQDYFVFTSPFGAVRLRKRTAYPTTFAYAQDSKLLVGYGDKAAGESIAHNDLDKVPESSFYFSEFLYMEIDCVRQHVLLQRDALSTLPIFVCSQPQSLILSNRFERVCQLANKKQLHVNSLTVAEILTGQSTQYRTLFSEINALCDRAHITWSHGNLQRVTAPDSSLLNVMLHRKGDARYFHRYFDEVLSYYCGTYAHAGATVAAELSGGTDSSLLNYYLASKGINLHAGTFLFADDIAKRQRKKLTDLETYCGLTSYRVALEPNIDYPLATMVRNGEWQPLFHDHELYLEPYKRLIEYFAANNADVVFSGIGGDELSDNLPRLSSDHALEFASQFYKSAKFPEAWAGRKLQDYIREAVQNIDTKESLPLQSLSVVTAPLSVNNPYLDYNIWPVMPLANPALYLYCQSLPIQYRFRKNLFRAYMKVLGLPPSVYASPTKEQFGSFFYHAVRSNLQKPFEELMRHSALAEAGLIDPDIACKTWESAKMHDSTRSGNYLFALYRLMTIEINLQVLGVPAQATAIQAS